MNLSHVRDRTCVARPSEGLPMTHPTLPGGLTHKRARPIMQLQWDQIPMAAPRAGSCGRDTALKSLRIRWCCQWNRLKGYGLNYIIPSKDNSIASRGIPRRRGSDVISSTNAGADVHSKASEEAAPYGVSPHQDGFSCLPRIRHCNV